MPMCWISNSSWTWKHWTKSLFTDVPLLNPLIITITIIVIIIITIITIIYEKKIKLGWIQTQ